MGNRKYTVRSSQSATRPHPLRIDGSAVTTTSSAAGLLFGSSGFNISKGSGGASNEVTLTPKDAFKLVPVLTFGMITTNCHVQIKSLSTSEIVLETVQVDDAVTGVDDADFHVFVWGSDTAGED